MTVLGRPDMTRELHLSRSRLTTPRAAALADILFSLLLIASLVLIRITVPANPADAGAWLSGGAGPVTLGLVLALFLLLSLGTFEWAPLVFPLWVLLISVHILLANLRDGEAGGLGTRSSSAIS